MRSFEFPIEAGHIQEFKRSVGDFDAVFDADAAAPPTFMVSADRYDPDYDRRLRSDREWPPVAPETGSGFHAGMVFEYHRHPRAGEVLTATVADGEEWTKQGRRGGALRFREIVTTFVDADGEPCVTARWINVRAATEVRE